MPLFGVKLSAREVIKIIKDRTKNLVPIFGEKRRIAKKKRKYEENAKKKSWGATCGTGYD